LDPVVIVWIAIGVIAGAFLLLLATILVIKVRRQMGEARRRRRRAILEPIVLRHGAAAAGTLLEALPAPPGPVDRDVLEAILLDQVQAVRGAVRERFSRAFQELGLVDRQVRRLQSGRAWIRADAAEKLGRMRAPGTTAALARAMEDPVLEVRLRAARALASAGGHAAVSRLVAALSQPSRWSTIRIADILSGMGEDAVADLLREYPRLPAAARVPVIDIFGRVRSLTAIPVLRAILDDSDTDIRARAAHALGQIGDPGSVPDLIRTLSDPEWPVRAMAARALGRISGTEAVEPLCGVLTDGQWWVRVNAAEALRAKGPQGQSALIGMLDSDDPYAREQSVLMLEEAGVLDEAVGNLRSSDGDARALAEALIRRVAVLGRTDLLRQLGADHTDPEVREDLAGLLAAPPAGGGAP
jgi:HEAT repeat protein